VCQEGTASEKQTTQETPQVLDDILTISWGGKPVQVQRKRSAPQVTVGADPPRPTCVSCKTRSAGAKPNLGLSQNGVTKNLFTFFKMILLFFSGNKLPILTKPKFPYNT
jgi:hypothetical protein